MRSIARLLLPLALLVPLAARAFDDFGDGVDSATEDALLQRFAPVILLAPGERARPANVDWYLARSRLDPAGRRPATAVTQASLLGDWMARLQERRHAAAVLRPGAAARPGSSDPRDWVVYGHVYPSQEGGLLLQYWFFYPFNDGYFFFDHDADWEHITVRLDRDRRPAGAYYARHADIDPGPWFSWDRLAREGEHPVVLSARGTHASYALLGQAPWFDVTCPTRDPAQAAARGCQVWRSAAGAGAGGVLDLGQRFHPRPGAAFVSWPGRWGAKGPMGLESDRPPLGPAFQRSWCSLAGPGCG